MAANMIWRTASTPKVGGDITIPGDKSISHRAIMFAALAEGTTQVSGFLEGEDCLATIRAFRAMGVPIARHGAGRVSIEGRGLHGLSAPQQVLDVGNSGTSMRLMAGVLAGQAFSSELIGDASLMKRPMRRVTEPLRQMGAVICTGEAGTAPLRIKGSRLHGIDYTLPVPSAQLKSCLLLAGLYAQECTVLRGCGISRDHSERMLRGFGVALDIAGDTIIIDGGQTLSATDIIVPGDVSSAAFFIVAALIAPVGTIVMRNVGINPTRAAVIDIMQEMGGQIEVLNPHESGGEPVADLRVTASRLKGIVIDPKYVPIAIDEFPIIFIAAACAEGTTVATELGELRVKESDRLATMARGLQANGVNCVEEETGLTIHGGGIRGGGMVHSAGDHRIAMSFAVAGMVAEQPIVIEDCATVATSFPNFQALAAQIGMNLEVIADA